MGRSKSTTTTTAKATKKPKYAAEAVALEKPHKNGKKLVAKMLEAKKKHKEEKKRKHKKETKKSNKKKSKKQESESDDSESESDSESENEEPESESESDNDPSDSDSEGEEEKESVAAALKIHAEIKKKVKGGVDGVKKPHLPPYAATKKMVRAHERHAENQYLVHDQVRPHLPLPYETVRGLVKLAAAELGIPEVRFSRLAIESIAQYAYGIHAEYLFPETRAQWESQQSAKVLATPEEAQTALASSPMHPPALIQAARNYWAVTPAPGQVPAIDQFWALKEQCDSDPEYIKKQQEMEQRAKAKRDHDSDLAKVVVYTKDEENGTLTKENRVELTKCHQRIQAYEKERANAAKRKMNEVIVRAEKELIELTAREERVKARIEVLESDAVGGLSQSKHQVDKTRKAYLELKDEVNKRNKVLDDLKAKRKESGMSADEVDDLNALAHTRDTYRKERDEAEKIFHHAERAFKKRTRELAEAKVRLAEKIPAERIEVNKRLVKAKEEVVEYKAKANRAQKSLALAKSELAPSESEDSDAMEIDDSE